MELEQIEGTVEDIIYENPDNGYTVFEISGGGAVTVVCGIVGELHAGESVVCRGKYENHATYGRQFHAQECETDMPKDLEAVYAFLASGSLPYIGARTANKIIDKFGAAALEVIANDPAQLTLIPGISADKADRIQQEFKRMFGMRELIAYLAQFEIGPRKAMEVFRAFGPGAMQAISANPYLLCGEPLQLDFRHADSIAQYYQMAGDCAQRLEAALLRTLRHNAGNGHTCLPRAQLLETASNFIHQPPEKLAAALDNCIQTGKLEVRMFDGTPYIYLPDLLAAEQDIADRLAMLTRRGKQTARNLDKNIQILELAQGFAYAPLQKEAIRKAMTENCLVLTGGPGTGKTTTVRGIVALFQKMRRYICTPYRNIPVLNQILSKNQLEQLLDGEHFEPIEFEDEGMKKYLEIYQSQNWMLIGGKLLSKKLALWFTMNRFRNHTSLKVLYLNGMTAKAKVDLDIRGDRYTEFTAVLKELIGYEGTLKLYEKEEQLAQKFASFFPEQTSEQDRVAAFLSQDVTLIRQDYIQTFSPPPDPRKKKRSRRERE